MGNGILISIQSAIILLLDLYVLEKAYKGRPRDVKHRYFQQVALAVSVQQLLSLLVRMVKSKLIYCDISLQYVFYIGMFVSMAFSARQLMIYLLYLRKDREKISTAVRGVMLIPCFVMTVAAVSSPWTHWIFYLDASLNYHRGSLFILQLGCPYIFAFVAAVMMLGMLISPRNTRERDVIRYFLCFIGPAVVGGILQVALNVDGGYSAIGCSISVLLLYMEFYVDEIRELERLKDVAAANSLLQDQLEKIEQLNQLLKENQGELEAVSDAQKKQLEEISKLNVELETALDKAEAASNAKTEFLNNMSHDIRTPMNAILGYLQLLRKNTTDPTMQHYEEKMQMSGEYLLSLINNVLDMARIEGGRAELNLEELLAGNVVAGVLDVLGAQAKEKDIKFVHSVEVVHERIMCDKLKLQMVFSNIISNAVKYTPNGGMVTITTEELPTDRQGIVFFKTVVQDTGIGMSAEFLPHLFENFAREKNTTTGKVAGTGLGMPIVKNYVELMDGTVEVESEVGVGTKLTVIIPHQIVEEGTEPEQEKLVPDAETGIEQLVGKRILLAEDNELNAEIARTVLEGIGLGVDRVEDGVHCVERIQQEKAGTYDLILMDIQMPRMDGYETTQAIRSLSEKAKAEIPIIAMTANTFAEDKQNALDAGMNAHIAKPIQIPTLIETLGRVLTS